MKRILKSFRPTKQNGARVGTGDLTGSGRASLEQHELDGDVPDYSHDDDTSLFTSSAPPTNAANYDYDFSEVPAHASSSVSSQNHQLSSASSQNKPGIAAAAATTSTSNNNAVAASTKRPTAKSSTAGSAAALSSSASSPTRSIAKPIASQPLRAEETRSLVKKFIADIWNRGELDLIPDVCSPSLRFNGNTGFDRVGHDGLARMVATIRDALDEYHCEIHSMVVEDNKCFCRLRFTGRHVGPLLGFPATGKTVAWMGATEFTVQNHKILKVWELGDSKSLEEQLSSTDE